MITCENELIFVQVALVNDGPVTLELESVPASKEPTSTNSEQNGQENQS